MPRKKVKGHLVLIGGAEDKVYNKVILQDFFHLAGGTQARIVVLPTASSFPGVGELYRKILCEWGAACDLLFIDTRADADSDEHVEILREATGIFLAGGDQLKITSVRGFRFNIQRRKVFLPKTSTEEEEPVSRTACPIFMRGRGDS